MFGSSAEEVAQPVGRRRRWVVPAALACAIGAASVLEARTSWDGTGRRLAHGLALDDGHVLSVGGKTGTGDNRFEIAAPTGRRLLVLNRTAMFVFVLGDRFFGALTAYVPGQAATRYTFSSALPVELLRRLGPALQPLLRIEAVAESDGDMTRSTAGGVFGR